ncbi:hypothetical protein L1887_36843 [Cichorium endivia]|nr:hypothetical protein L1887_36843 [Cichorium endivia]
MKGERRQHGAVRCYDINQPLLARERYEKMVDSATATRLFAKVTNQSKYTGKCHKAWCSDHHHKHAVCKSRDKTKGTMKIRSIDPANEWTKYPVGNSATSVLAYLANEEGYNDDDYDYEGRVEETHNYAYGYAYHDDNHHDDEHSHDHDDGTHGIDLCAGFAIGIAIVADEHVNDVDDEDDDDDDDDDDDAMSFCDVGLCWGHGDGDEYGDDGWYLVGGQMQ